MKEQALRRAPFGALMLVAVTTVVLSMALGEAEASGDPFGDDVAKTGEVSGTLADVLGVADGTIVQIGTVAGGGSVTVSFVNNVAYDGLGADLRIHTIDALAPATALIEVSADGVTFVPVGSFDDTTDRDIDLSTLGTRLAFVSAVRFTHVSGELPGFDLDAVEALHGIGLEGDLVTLLPVEDTNVVGADHAVSATVTDATVPIPGILVSFAVASGPNAGDDDDDIVANALGVAVFTYTGDGGAGVDAIVAWLDYDLDGVVDAGEPSAGATKRWIGDTGTVQIIDANGGVVAVGDTLTVVVEDKDLDTTVGQDTVNVVVTSTTDPVGLLALTLTETGANTGVFTGDFTLGAVTDAVTRTLAAVDADTITASYDDALDENGTNPAPVTDSVTVGEDADKDDEDEKEKAEKVVVCHIPSGDVDKAHTIEVGAPAEQAHLAHGDVLGPCDEVLVDENDEDEDKREEQLDAFCERKPDHKRCEDLSAESQNASSIDLEDEDDEGDEDDEDEDEDEKLGDVQQGSLSAFCEQKPDHRRCS